MKQVFATIPSGSLFDPFRSVRSQLFTPEGSSDELANWVPLNHRTVPVVLNLFLLNVKRKKTHFVLSWYTQLITNYTNIVCRGGIIYTREKKKKITPTLSPIRACSFMYSGRALIVDGSKITNVTLYRGLQINKHKIYVIFDPLDEKKSNFLPEIVS